MKKTGTAVLLISAGLLASCGQSDMKENSTVQAAATSSAVQVEEKQPLSDVKSATDQKEEGAEQFNSLFEDEAITTLFSMLQRDRQQIEKEAGTPVEEGSFEGAAFMDYGSGTFFFPDGSQQAETFAVQNPSVQAEKVSKQIGSPDEEYENKMEELWTQEYKYEDGTIIVEKPDETADEVSTVWFETSS
ncbi:hypothetical protein [Salibacterium lacus]|uniref:DUF4309 domain-containing protein n=1 Tax=Salibacterium lacus TaxID=1898109 RepID=A0ABW5SZ12_9BACI